MALRVCDHDPPEFTLQKLQEDVKDIRAHVICQICIRPMYEPYTIACGHTFCYSCLAQWFASHNRSKTCPECRTKVLYKPAPAYVLRDMVQLFVSREALLQDSETLVEHHEHREAEARIVEADRLNSDPITGGLFRGCFKAQPRRAGGIIDYEDGGITRCPNCAWELEGGYCAHCGIPIHDEPAWSDDDGSLSNASESLEDLRMGMYSSEDDSMESDEVREYAGLRQSLRRGDHGVGHIMGDVSPGSWRGRGATYDHVHSRRDHDGGLSDQETHSITSTVNAVDDNSVIGESEESNTDPNSGTESEASSMRSFLDDDEPPFDREQALPANDTYWLDGESSDAASFHDASNSQNDWSDTHEDENLRDEEPIVDQIDGYESSNRLSTPDRTHHCNSTPVELNTAFLQHNQPSNAEAGTNHRRPMVDLKELITGASDSEQSESSLPPPPQRSRKRRHIVEDDSSNDSSASGLDTRRPRKRKSSSQDTTTVGHPSPDLRARDQPSQSLQRARDGQSSAILIDSSPARPFPTNPARRRQRAERPRIASHLRRSANERARPSRTAETPDRSPSTTAADRSESRHNVLVPQQLPLPGLRGKSAVHMRQEQQERLNRGIEIRL